MTEGSPTLDAALDYAAKGIPVFPCKPDKRPYIGGGFHAAVTDEGTIRSWWQQWPDALIGVPTGPRSGIAVLDIDNKPEKGKDGFAQVPDWETRSPVISRTGSGGAHLFFKAEGAPHCTSDIIARGVDTRGEGGYVIVPPSRGYTWKNGSDLSALPPWPDDLRPPERRRAGDEATMVGDSPPIADEAAVMAALAVIDPDSPRGTWLAIGYALFKTFGTQRGFKVWGDWSAKGKKYDPHHIEADWRPIVENEGYSHTAASIFHFADEAAPGWRNFVGIDPINLWGRFEPPPLPRGMLPKVIEDYAFTQATMMGADPGGVALAALVVCAAAIPDRVKLRVKINDRGWHESARLWGCLIGNPSTKKSPIINHAAEPLRKIEAKLHRRWREEMDVYEALNKEERQQADEPKRRRVLLMNSTIEAAQEVLKDNHDGVLSYQDELSGWFGQMDKYGTPRGGSADRGFWLTAYNGGAYNIDRVQRGTAHIPNLSISVLGGIQPEVIVKLATGVQDDGLLIRFMPVLLSPGAADKDEALRFDVAKYAEAVERLHQITPPEAPLTFSADAQALRQRLANRHYDLQRGFEAFNLKMANHIGKYDGIFARMCVLFHCIESLDAFDMAPTISVDTAQRAADFLHKFLMPHALAFYGGVLALADDFDAMTNLAGFILARKLDKVTNRIVNHGDRAMRRLKRHEIEALCDRLDGFGWLARVPGPRRDSPPDWLVNPEVHRKFAERAEQEAADREAARQFVQDLVKDSVRTAP